MKKTRHGLWFVLAAALLAGWSAMQPGGPLERFWLDWQLRWAAPTQAPVGVLVYDIDDASLQRLQPRLGAWPYRREVYALLIDALRRAGARAIALDLLLLDPSEGDAQLAREIAAPGAPVLLAAAGVGEPTLPVGAAQPVRWPQLLQPHGPLRRANAVGVVSIPLDRDGRLRRFWLQHRSGEVQLASLPLALLRHTHPGLSPPADSVLLPYAREPTGEVRSLPIADLMLAVLDGREQAPALSAAKGQVVLIGSSALLADRVMTPSGQWHGGSVLAQTYAGLRDGRWLRGAGGAPVLLLFGLLPSLWSLWRGRTQPRLATLWVVGAALALPLLCWGLAQAHRWIDPSPALAALAAGLLGQLLLHQHRTRTESLRLEQEQARSAAASAANSRLLAQIGQDIRRPLLRMLELAQALHSLVGDTSGHQQLNELQQAGGRLAGRIDALLDLSALQAGQLILHPAPFRLRELLDETLAALQPAARRKDLRCTLIAPGELPEWVLGDRQRLQQVLQELLGNALQFTEQGLVDLHVRVESDDRIGLTVADTGVGIAADQQQDLFEAYAGGSAGLGLALARELVRLMGGEISVHSVPGAGSRFAFSVPLPGLPLPQ